MAMNTSLAIWRRSIALRSIDVRQLFEQHRSRRSWAANPQTSARLTCLVAPSGVVYHNTSLERSDRWHWFVWLSVRRPNLATLRQKQTRQSLLASAPMVQEAKQEATWSREGYGGVRTRSPYIFEVLGWTLQEVERQHWADLLAAAPREYEESKRFLENMRNKSGSFENM